MDSRTMVEAYDAKLQGQQLLWEDHEMTLRNTPFKPINPDFDREALIHWWMNVYVPDGSGDENTPYEVYKTWSTALWGAFKYIKTDGYNSETNQTALMVMCYKKKPFEPQLAELLMWLPHVKETTDENGKGLRKGKRIGIFESSLSEGGVFGLTVYSDTESVLFKIYYSHYRVLQRFNSTKEALDYIRNNVWYEDGENG